jgi:precorrin-6B methylase 2
MIARTLIVLLATLLAGVGDARAQMRGGVSRSGTASRGGVFLHSHGHRSGAHITLQHGRGVIRRGIFPRGVFIGVGPVPVFRTPLVPFHHAHPQFVAPFFPRRSGVVIVEVPAVIGTTVMTRTAPGVTYLDPSIAGPAPNSIPGRSPGSLAPFDPTPQEIVERILILAGISRGDVVYDLGSGDGRLVIAAAKTHGVKAVGFEIDAGLVKLARENARREGVENLVEIHQQDFMTADVSPATVVTLYLSRDGNLAVRPKLMRELRPGARIVSYGFDMADWAPKITEAYRDAAGDSHLLYLWQISQPTASNDSFSSTVQ